MVTWDELDFSTVKTGDIKQAEITINKYRVEDGEVKEQEEGVPITDEELDEIKQDVGSRVQEALDEFEETGEVSSMDVDLGDDAPDPTETVSASQSDSSQDTTTTSSTDDSGSEESTTDEDEADDEERSERFEEAVSLGRTIAREEGITKNDYADFAEGLRNEGYTDQSFISDVWGELRDDNTIGRFPPNGDGETDDGGDADEEDAEEADEETDEQDAGGEQTPLEVGRDVVEEENLTNTDWPTFAAEMRDRGITEQDTHSEVWSELKEEGTIGQPQSESSGGSSSSESSSSDEETQHPSGLGEDDFGIPVGTDLLMVQTDEQASEMVISTLNEAIDAEEVIAMPITSDIGEAVIEPMESDVTTPFYLEATEEGLVQHPLEMLVEKYT